MYKRFAFEGEVHQSLSCVPLTVRRKLDVAGLKISLAGWQALAREERLSLCHLPIDSDDEVAVYQEVMRGFCDRHAVPLTAITDPKLTARTWNAPELPDTVGARLAEAGARLTTETWRALDEESRFALLKMAEPKQSIAKFKAVLGELDLLPPPSAEDRAAAEACDRMDEGGGQSSEKVG